jgi:hypothetical protein
VVNEVIDFCIGKVLIPESFIFFCFFCFVHTLIVCALMVYFFYFRFRINLTSNAWNLDELVFLLKRFFFVIETFATTQVVFLVPLLDFFFDLNLPRGIDSWFSTELGRNIHIIGSGLIPVVFFLF